MVVVVVLAMILKMEYGVCNRQRDISVLKPVISKKTEVGQSCLIFVTVL